MEVRPGFKQTELGLIPSSWKVDILNHCVRRDAPICYGILMPGPHCNGGIPVVKVRDIIDGRIDETGLLMTHPAIDHAYRRSRLAAGDLLVTIRGTTGRVALVPASLDGANITQDTARVRVNADIDARFLFFALHSEAVQRQIALHTIGQAVRGINIRDVKHLAVAFPDRPSEQRAIAAALNDVDALLGGLDRLIVKKRNLKRATMQQLLTGQARLPGFHGEWEVKALRDIVSTPITDGPHLTPKFLADGVPFLSVNNLVNNRLDLRVLRFVSRADHLEFSKKCRPQRGDILFGKAASVGMVALIDTDMELNIWSPLALIRVSHRASETFVFYALQAMHIHRQIVLLTNSSSQGNIGMSDIGSLAIPLPKHDEQGAIAAVLSDIDAELSALEARRDKTRALKQAMMQELLTGRTRLVPAGGANV